MKRILNTTIDDCLQCPFIDETQKDEDGKIFYQCLKNYRVGNKIVGDEDRGKLFSVLCPLPKVAPLPTANEYLASIVKNVGGYSTTEENAIVQMSIKSENIDTQNQQDKPECALNNGE